MNNPDAVSNALDMIHKIYLVKEDLWDFDALDWDKFFLLLDDIKLDRKRAIQLVQTYSTSSSSEVEKFFATKLAGEIMNPVEEDEKEEVRSLIKLLDEMSLHEDSTQVLESIAISLGYPYMFESKKTLLRLSEHEDYHVRLSATISLCSLIVEEDEEIVTRLKELLLDPDPKIANWAEFGLESNE